MGPFLYSTDIYLDELIIEKNFELAVMINASEFFDEDRTIQNSIIKEYFIDSKLSKIDIVRVAVNFNNYESTKKIMLFCTFMFY